MQNRLDQETTYNIQLIFLYSVGIPARPGNVNVYVEYVVNFHHVFRTDQQERNE